MVEPGADGAPFSVLGLGELARLRAVARSSGAAPVDSFLVSGTDARITEGQSDFRYEVLEDSGGEQLIEVVESFHDGDNTIWSRYRATREDVTPVSSRMMYFGYLFAAFPYALGAAIMLYGAGLLLRRRSAWVQAQHDAP